MTLYAYKVKNSDKDFIIPGLYTLYTQELVVSTSGYQTYNDKNEPIQNIYLYKNNYGIFTEYWDGTVSFERYEQGDISDTKYISSLTIDSTAYTIKDKEAREQISTKQDVITDLATIRDGASKGATALQIIPIARANVVGGVAGGNWLTVNQTTGKMECGELTKAQYNSALGYTFISKTTLENRLVDKQDKLTSGTNIKTINGESVLGSGDLEIKAGYHPDIFSTKWSDHLINDIQWLRADTFSWQSGDVYKTAYDTLVSEYATGTTETEGSITFKRTTNGYKIATADMESAILSKYNSDGIAWYYIVDTANKRFKLPRTKFGFKGFRDWVGNDVDESLPNITGALEDGYKSENVTPGRGSLYAINTGLNNLGLGSGWQTTNIYFDASRSSSTYQDNAPVQERATQMYLYFYVGEYARGAIEQTAGITTEQLNAKVDIDSSWGFPSSRYTDLTLGANQSTYTAPANGWFSIWIVVNSGGYIGLENETKFIYSEIRISSPTVAGVYVPCSKGDIVKLGYEQLLGAASSFKFIYAEGSN